MNLKKISVAAVILGSVSACKIIQVVPEGGSIVSRTGSNNCSESSTCEIDVENGSEFSDTFTAVPNQGFRFVAWKEEDRYLCGGLAAPCELEGVPGSFTDQDIDLFLEPVFEVDSSSASILGDQEGVAATINGSPIVFNGASSFVFAPGFTILDTVIPDSLTLLATLDDPFQQGCQQCESSWNIVVPAIVGTHECQSAVSGMPGSISLTLENVGYSTNGNGFIVPECTITISEYTENSVRGSFTAKLVNGLDNNSLFEDIQDGEFYIVD